MEEGKPMCVIFVPAVFAVGLLFAAPPVTGPIVNPRMPPPPRLVPPTDEQALQEAGIATEDADLLRLIERHAAREVDEREVARLLRQLDAADFKEREKASQALLALGPPARKALEAARKSDNPEVAKRVADCLDQWRREEPYVDYAVRVFLQRRQVEGLGALLRLKDPAIRMKALDALDAKKADSADLVPLLLEALDDTSDGMASKSQNVLWLTIQPQHFPHLLAAAKDKRPRMRSRSFLLFGKFPTEAATVVPLLVDALKDENRDVRRAAAQALGYFGSEKETLQALLTALEDPDEPPNPDQASVAEWAASSLGACRKQNPDLVISTLARLARIGKTERMRSGAASSLGSIGGTGDDFTKDVLRILIGFLKDKEDPRLRSRAAWGIYQMRAKAAPAVPALLEALDTRDVTDPAVARNIRLAVLNAFFGVGPGAKDAVPMLIEVAQSPKYHPEERRYAVSALGKIGPAAQEAIPLLTRITVEKTDPGLKQAAQWALQQLRR